MSVGLLAQRGLSTRAHRRAGQQRAAHPAPGLLHAPARPAAPSRRALAAAAQAAAVEAAPAAQQRTPAGSPTASDGGAHPSAAAAGAAAAATAAHPLYDARPFADCYTLGEVLGAGTYGTVRTCTHRASGEQYAVKVLQRRRNRVDRTDIILREASMAFQLRACPAVARTTALHADAYNIYIVQELLIGGSVQQLLDASARGALSEGEAAGVMRGLLAALAACHAQGICYGDVKPANIMLASLYPSVAHLLDPAAPKGRLDARLVDFGCAQAVDGHGSGLSGLSGTPVFMAPEVAGGEEWGAGSDVWGAGVVLYLMLTGRFPYYDAGLESLRQLPLRQVLEDVKEGRVLLDTESVRALSPGARALLGALLQKDPARRLSAAEAAAHPWLAEAAAAGGA